jgi:nucleoid-associated protein YgaU
MRLRVGRHFGVAALYLLMHLGGGAGCSSSDEGEEDIEATEEGAEDAEGEEVAEGEEGAVENAEGEGQQVAENAEQGNEYAEGEGEEVAEEGYSEEATEEVADETAEVTEEMVDESASGETEEDLKEIISDINSQAAPMEEMAATDATAAPTDAAASAPVDAGMTPDAATAAAPQQSAPVGGVLPEMGSKMPYVVRPGDTLGKIAQRIYGDISKWRMIQQLTGLNNPSKIYPGDVVYYQLSPEASNFARTYESLPRQEVVAAEGDTLASIAAKVLGSSRHWKEIWRQNDSIDNPDVITPGQTIYYINPQAMASFMSDRDQGFAALNQDTESVVSVSFSSMKNFADANYNVSTNAI